MERAPRVRAGNPGGDPLRYVVLACPRCGARRVVEQGRKSASCGRCPATIDVARSTPLLAASTLGEAQAYMGEAASRDAGEARAYRSTQPRAPRPQAARERERLRIAQAAAGASGRLNQLKLILRRGFEAFGELTPEDLEAIADRSGLALSGTEIADSAVELGLAGRAKSGALVPLREGR